MDQLDCGTIPMPAQQRNAATFRAQVDGYARPQLRRIPEPGVFGMV
jgi:hypothetical protein